MYNFITKNGELDAQFILWKKRDYIGKQANSKLNVLIWKSFQCSSLQWWVKALLLAEEMSNPPATYFLIWPVRMCINLKTAM